MAAMHWTDRSRMIAACGLALTVIGGVFGADEATKWALAAFGCTYGGLWLSDQ